MTNPTSFSGEITVASRIVDYLSSGLYESPAACLKELINNSYDADAERVEVFIKPDADRIIIEDDGHGMDRADFIRHFSRISESYKRSDSDVTESGRPKIGKIGIGFIAANEICDVMEIYSTKAGSKELLHVHIFFEKMRQDPEERRRNGEGFAKGDYTGEVSETDPDSHFTQIFLKRVRGEAREILAGAQTGTHTAGTESLYGLSANSVLALLKDPNLKSWAEFDSYSQNFLRVGLNVPVAYYPNWIPSRLAGAVQDLTRHAERLDFALFFDGTQVLKPVVFSPGDRGAFISRFEFEGNHMGALGYFYVQHRAIRPQEIQGLLVRIRNAAVGGYDPSFLGFSPSEGRLFQSWSSGEIWADDRLEEAMNIDRRTLRISHPAFVEFQSAVHEHLSALLKRARAELYTQGNKVRKEERAHTVVKQIAEMADQTLAPIAPAIATEVKRLWTTVAEEERGAGRVLKKYDLTDLYEIFVEIAKDILTPEQIKEIVRRLTHRLSK
jgi:hypothetical protein